MTEIDFGRVQVGGDKTVTQVVEVTNVSNEISQRIVNGFLILGVLGRGSFGTVYKARLDNQEVALKEMSKKLLQRNLTYRSSRPNDTYSSLDSLKDEIAIQSTLDHPSIIHLYQIWNSPKVDSIFLVFELAEHQSYSIDPTNDKTPLSSDTSLRYITGLAAGLDYLHRRCIIHRDIKPENLLVKAGTLKIADFGVSQRITDSHQRLKRQAGTLAFWPPEVCSYQNDVTFEGPPLDMWAAGITLYIFLVGKLPYSTQDSMDLFGEIADGENIELPSGIDKRMRLILEGLLARDPTVRLTSQGLLNALKDGD